MKTIIKELQSQIEDLEIKIAYESSLLKLDFFTEIDKENLRREILGFTNKKAQLELLLEILKQKHSN